MGYYVTCKEEWFGASFKGVGLINADKSLFPLVYARFGERPYGGWAKSLLIPNNQPRFNKSRTKRIFNIYCMNVFLKNKLSKLLFKAVNEK